MDWSHGNLLADLAETRRDTGDIVGEEVSLGSYSGGGIADVVSIRPSWTTAAPTIWEIKVSRADFLSDIRSGKWRRYLPYCDRFYFATPSNMIHRKEIPAGAGFAVRNERGWHTIKADSTKLHRQEDMTPDLLFSMLLNGHPAPWKPQTRRQRIESHLRQAENSDRFRGLALSERVRAAMNRAERIRQNGQDLERVRKRLLQLLRHPEEDMDLMDIVWRLERELGRPNKS